MQRPAAGNTQEQKLWINPPLKIVPRKRTVPSLFRGTFAGKSQSTVTFFFFFFFKELLTSAETAAKSDTNTMLVFGSFVGFVANRKNSD